MNSSLQEAARTRISEYEFRWHHPFRVRTEDGRGWNYFSTRECAEEVARLRSVHSLESFAIEKNDCGRWVAA